MMLKGILFFSLLLGLVAGNPSVTEAKTSAGWSSAPYSVSIHDLIPKCSSNPACNFEPQLGSIYPPGPADLYHNADWGPTMTLSNITASIGYSVKVYDNVTGVEIADGATIPVGTTLRFEPDYTASSINWVGTGGYNDSPFGQWDIIGPTQGSYLTTTGSVGSCIGLIEVYSSLQVARPAITFSHSGTVTLSSCNANNSICTVSSGGTLNSIANIGATTGQHYGAFNKSGNTCINPSQNIWYPAGDTDIPYVGQNPALLTASGCSSPVTEVASIACAQQANTNKFVLNVPAQSISFSFTVGTPSCSWSMTSHSATMCAVAPANGPPATACTPALDGTTDIGEETANPAYTKWCSTDWLCSCGAPSVCPPPQVEGNEITCMRAILWGDEWFEGPGGFCTSPADCTAKRNALYASWCTGLWSPPSAKFPCYCMVDAPLVCGGAAAGPLPTLVMTGQKFVVLDEKSIWSRVLAFARKIFARPVAASGPELNLSLGDSVQLNWTSTNTASCSLSIPSQLPQAVPLNGSFTVVGLPSGTHYISMTCIDATGTQNVADTVVVNITPNELRICPPTITMTMGSVYQMRAFYLIGGVDCASLGPALDVSNLVTWSSVSPAVATVGNNPNGGRINAGFTAGTADISISSYLGRTAPISQVVVVGGYAICPANASTYVGGTTQLRAYFSALSPVDCSNLTGTTEVTGSVTWTSSNNGIATVTGGLVTGVTGGSADISVGPYSGAPALPVTVAVSGGYKICPASAIIGSAGFSFYSYYNPSGLVDCDNLAGASDVTGSVTWSSSNPGVATVGNGGTAGVTTPVGVGSSNISTTPYAGIPSGNAVANVICVPSNSCMSAGPAATAANICPSDMFTIDDGCGFIITCSGTRTCDFNWKEVGQ
jgi:hypothetical protein